MSSLTMITMQGKRCVCFVVGGLDEMDSFIGSQWNPGFPHLDVFLSHIKTLGYSEQIQDVVHLKEWITAVIASITPDALRQVWTEVEYSCVVNGAHIENIVMLFKIMFCTKCNNNISEHIAQPFLPYKLTPKPISEDIMCKCINVDGCVLIK